MWPRFQLAVLVVACTTASPLYAQTTSLGSQTGPNGAVTVQSSSPARLLNLDEGLAVLGAAMETAHHRAIRQDCSHFVHAIYERAGFPYSYENSVTLYDGTGDFQRVTRPQPGDLIVWRGHMGILVNPVQHSFFSSLRTGSGVEKYDSHYWRKRGRPRFYRYVKTASPGLTLASAKAASSDESTINAEQAEPVGTETRTEVASNSVQLPVETSDGLPIMVTAERATPEALRQALEEKFSDANANFAHADLLNSSKPVVIIENFQVKKVHVKHDQGWAEVHMNEPSSMAGGQANLQRRSEKQRWPLYRNGKKWQLELPTNAIYVPKDTAVRLLAHQLATITGRGNVPPSRTQQEAQLARLLDRLLGE
ncbi:MAG TPA: NlpC/P60 family protein [Terriglobales bacterium]|nr:NlpC/P60 family protein [Terriglobales bacterium]